ncbi:MAG: peptide MFS transporter [Candidatus Eisenbacteria bacterium]|nr:peptide MFS transporter [Candidatus Eisenbacteria bacterium]
MAASHAQEKHPKGLYVLFATEMWERFSFYSMLAMFTLYLRDTTGQGFGWTSDRATGLYANYLMCVYASPLIGGWIADRGLGYRRSVMIGGVFFMIGHLLLSFQSINIVYAALACLVVGNGFFKPNVSAMVGNLYPEGSRLKDRAYNIFYMGINIGAFLAPIAAEFVKSRWGFHPAFAMAAVGMLISVTILWRFKSHVMSVDTRVQAAASAPQPIDSVPTWQRISALIVIYLIVIVFWMVFHQNGSTLTYWANENTAWNVTGIISNAINPGWVLLLTFPLVGFWRMLDLRGKEPSTPTKMAIGMFCTATAFLVMFLAAKTGEASVAPGAGPYDYKVSWMWLVGAYGVLTLGELMLSPMGLSLVSKVAPPKHRGIMMGGWFVATAIGNKLTQIGQLWDDMPHSQFWLILSAAAAFMGIVLMALLKPLKKAMPGI